MQAYLDRLSDDKAMNLINKIGDIFKSFPALPSNLLDFIIKIAPYLALLSAVLTIIGGPLVGLLGTLASIATFNPLFLVWTLLTLVLMIIQAGLLFMAFSPLKEREMKGWIYLFWSEVIGLLQMVVNLLNNQSGSLLFGVFFAALWFYILFQMRPKYGPIAAVVEKTKM